MPVNCGHFNFKQIKILAGQRSIYLKLKDWIYSLINEPNSDDDAGKNSDVVQQTSTKPYRPRDHVYYSRGKFIYSSLADLLINCFKFEKSFKRLF